MNYKVQIRETACQALLHHRFGIKPELVVTYYRLRFQFEFLYRNGKQSTGLNHYRARSENKLDFHFNASLKAINVTKVEDWLSISKEAGSSFYI